MNRYAPAPALEHLMQHLRVIHQQPTGRQRRRVGGCAQARVCRRCLSPGPRRRLDGNHRRRRKKKEEEEQEEQEEDF